MASGNRYIIQKQLIEVEMENPPDAFQFRNRLGEVFYEKLLPRLESIFNDLDYPGKLIRIDHLPIDVGVIAVENWEEEFIERSADKIREALIQQNPVWITRSPGLEISKVDSSIEQELVNERLKEYSRLTGHELSEVFNFFLEHGRLPWFISSKPGLKLRELLKDLLASKSSFSTFLKDFLQEAKDEQVLRFIYQFDEKELDEAISLLADRANSSFLKDVIDKRSLLKHYLSDLFLSKAAVKKLLFFPLFKALSLQQQMPLNESVITRFVEGLMTYRSKRPDLILQEIIELLIPLYRNHSGSYSSAPAGSLLAAIQKLNNDTSFLMSAEKKTAQPKQEKRPEEPPDEIYIANAGLVLLHPFLPSYFKNVKLLDDKSSFVNEEAQMKAVLLTQYLITGETEMEEHQLVLNKILCGVNVDDIVYSTLELTQPEVDEANDMLTQVVEMWKMNGAKVNGSVEGLREAFLRRPGKLTKPHKDWRLQVEQKPYDMVMNSLPWGIGMIRNKWMSAMLWVDWA